MAGKLYWNNTRVVFRVSIFSGILASFSMDELFLIFEQWAGQACEIIKLTWPNTVTLVICTTTRNSAVA